MNKSSKTVLQVHFAPYRIERAFSSCFEEPNMASLPGPELFEMADILYEEQGRNFLGLSFAVDGDSQVVVRTFAKQCATPYVRYISHQDRAVFNGRYEGYGSRDRLEILIAKAPENYQCEYAGLWQTQWLFRVDAVEPLLPGSTQLWVEDIDDIADTHRLTLSV